MERVWMQCQRSHLRLADDPTRLVGPLVQLRLDAQASRRLRVSDQLHDRLEGVEWTAAPVLGDVTEETMLDLVPLAGAGRGRWNCNS